MMTQLSGPARLCAVKVVGPDGTLGEELGPFDADAFEIDFPEGK